jgi:flagella basal body P-ring formation protein FlgA
MTCFRLRTISVDKLVICLCTIACLIGVGRATATAATDQGNMVQVSVEDVTELVTHYLLEQFPGSTSTQQVQVTNVRLQGNLQVPDGEITYEIIPRTRQFAPGRVSLTVVAHVDGRPVRRVLASATLDMSSPAVVAAAPLTRNQTITRADIRLAEVNLTQLPAGFITDLQDVVGKRVRRNVSVGTPLHERLVEAPPIITRGNVVMIVAQSTVVSITVQGQAKEDGAVGEHIRVLNLSSGKEVFAKVLDENTVRVDF